MEKEGAGRDENEDGQFRVRHRRQRRESNNNTTAKPPELAETEETRASAVTNMYCNYTIRDFT